MAGGLAFAALGFLVFTRIGPGIAFWEFAAGTTIFSLGMSPVFTLTTDVIIGTAPAERAGAASAISETSAELGGALGIAIFGSIGVAVYRAAMADAVPAGVPEAAAEAARATLGGAIDAARALPASVGAPLAQAASAAFVRGIRLCAAVSAAGSAALAVLALVTLRGARSGAQQDP
jgi:DHA2 family multidrug resistance protein-like MFS transporter